MVALYAVALWAGLEALRSVLSFMFLIIGLAIIVLFQSEIRRTLARIGRKRWLGAGFHAPESANEILLAVEELAQRSTRSFDRPGARHRPAHVIESGVPLEALLSARSAAVDLSARPPLHDGAVIVQEGPHRRGRLLSAPDHNPALSRTFGTASPRRHRNYGGDGLSLNRHFRRIRSHFRGRVSAS